MDPEIHLSPRAEIHTWIKCRFMMGIESAFREEKKREREREGDYCRTKGVYCIVPSCKFLMCQPSRISRSWNPHNLQHSTTPELLWHKILFINARKLLSIWLYAANEVRSSILQLEQKFEELTLQEWKTPSRFCKTPSKIWVILFPEHIVVPKQKVYCWKHTKQS